MSFCKRDIKRAVITGPTGAIGTALCRYLADQGITVYAVCRPDSPRIDNLPNLKLVIPIFCNMEDLEQLSEKIPAKVDAFFHFAWAHTIGSGRNDVVAQTDNIRYTIDAVRAASALGCQVFVGAGSQAEYGRVEGILKPETPCFPENGYGMAKLCAGQMSRLECQRLGLTHIWVRILSVYGPYDGSKTMISSTIRSMLAGERANLTSGEQQWDYLYSGDAARAFYMAAVSGQDGAVYPLGSGTARPLKEYILTMRDAIDESLTPGFGDIPYGPLQVMYLQADISSLTEDTGFVPQISFDVGIRETIEWIRKGYHAG